MRFSCRDTDNHRSLVVQQDKLMLLLWKVQILVEKKGRANYVIQVVTCYSGLCLYQLLSVKLLSKNIFKHLKM